MRLHSSKEAIRTAAASGQEKGSGLVIDSTEVRVKLQDPRRKEEHPPRKARGGKKNRSHSAEFSIVWCLIQ
jgi:hypothetical protein